MTDINVTKYYADWCGPCKVIAPELEKLEADGVITLNSVNVEEDRESAKAAGVRSLPTLVVECDGMISTFHGIGPLKQLIASRNNNVQS